MSFFEPYKLHLMLYCSPDQMWISPQQYMWIWNSRVRAAGWQAPARRRARGKRHAGAGQPCAKQGQAGSRGAIRHLCPVQGTAQRETASATFDNVLRVPCSSSFADAPSGNHCMRFLDGGGAVLGDWCFPISFVIPEVPGSSASRDSW